MNVDTGEFYRGAELFKAIQRGDRLEDLTLRDPIDDRTPEQIERDRERTISETRSHIQVRWHRKKKVQR